MNFIEHAYFENDKYNRCVLKFTTGEDFPKLERILLVKYFGKVPKRRLVRKKWFKIAFMKAIMAGTVELK